MKRASLAALALVLGALLIWPSMKAYSAVFDDKQQKAIEDIVRNYLLKNPGLLEEVIDALRSQKEAEAAESRKEQLSKLYGSKSPFVHGKGDVTVIEFMDYNCPYCRRAFLNMMKVVEKDKKVGIRFVEFPVLGPESLLASKAAIAAEKQGKYFEFHRALITSPGRVDKDSVFELAKKVGLDVEKLKKDMESPEVQALIDSNLQLGESMGIQGTPAFFVGETFIPGAPENLEDVLREAIAATRKNGCSVC